jgi:hypothetical protein
MDNLQATIDANAKPGEPRITSEHYFTAAEGVQGATPSLAELDYFPSALEQVTFCVLVLKNGFTVTGKSAVLSAANFNAKIGREVARRDAIRQVWPLLGYAEAERLHAEHREHQEAASRLHG